MAVVRTVISNVPPNTETTVVYVVTSTTCLLKGFVGSGTSEAYWTLYVGGSPYFDYMTSSADRNAYMLFPSLVVNGGVEIALKVVHSHINNQSFRGSLIYDEVVE